MQTFTLVTGASRGIGFHIARVAAAGGADLILTARTEAALEELAAELRTAHGGRIEVIASDLGSPDGARQLVREISARGLQVGELVNNAGSGTMGGFVEQDPGGMEQMVQLNVTSLTLLSRLLLPGMLERGTGRIMNVASLAGFGPGPTMAVYHATKAFVLSLSTALARELCGTGVTVTCFCPGPTDDTGFDAVAGVEAGWLQRRTSLTAEQTARSAYRAMRAGRALAFPGSSVRVAAGISRMLPVGLSARLAHVSLRTSSPRNRPPA